MANTALSTWRARILWPCIILPQICQKFCHNRRTTHQTHKKGRKFVWTDDAQQAFDKLKQALIDTSTLSFPYPNIPCILDTDASDVAIGAVLSQVIAGEERPISFLSRVMNSAQRNYCPTRRELLAVVASLQHFRHYLLGNEVILRTDHHSLKWLKTFKRPEGILARWIETLSEFSYSIEHRSGRLHCNAYGVSRPHCKQCWDKPASTQSSSSRMRVIYHNWSATKQRPHPQSVAEISHHSVLSGDKIRQCETSSGSRHKDTDQCL